MDSTVRQITVQKFQRVVDRHPNIQAQGINENDPILLQYADMTAKIFLLKSFYSRSGDTRSEKGPSELRDESIDEEKAFGGQGNVTFDLAHHSSL